MYGFFFPDRFVIYKFSNWIDKIENYSVNLEWFNLQLYRNSLGNLKILTILNFYYKKKFFPTHYIIYFSFLLFSFYWTVLFKQIIIYAFFKASISVIKQCSSILFIVFKFLSCKNLNYLLINETKLFRYNFCIDKARIVFNGSLKK